LLKPRERAFWQFKCPVLKVLRADNTESALGHCLQPAT
jgi:hypothetical protein